MKVEISIENGGWWETMKTVSNNDGHLNTLPHSSHAKVI